MGVPGFFHLPSCSRRWGCWYFKVLLQALGQTHRKACLSPYLPQNGNRLTIPEF